MVLASTRQDNSSNLDSDFKSLATALCELLATAGVAKKPYSEELPFFRALTLEKRLSTVEQLRFYYELCVSQVCEGASLRNSQTFTWRALKKCGLTPASDFLSRITAGDIVEIYNCDGMQIFRNLEFFEFCSYTLEDLYCREWWVLYRRDQHITDMVRARVQEVFNHEHPDGLLCPAPKHILQEIASSEKFRVSMEYRFLGPLYENNAVKAMIAIESVCSLPPYQGLGQEFSTI